jgi:hypothetical protein
MRMNTEREHNEQQTKQSRWGFRGMTVRNWLEILIVPMVLVGIGLLFEMQQAEREDRRADAEQELAEQRAKDEALQAYLNQKMSTLLIEKDLRSSAEDSEVRSLARVRTLTVLRRLDPGRKADVMYFLMEAELIQRVEGSGPIIKLAGADLSGTDLSAVQVSIIHDKFYNVTRGVSLVGADLRAADLSGANLNEAQITDQMLFAAASLEGATMPNGKKYEDLLKSAKAREESG